MREGGEVHFNITTFPFVYQKNQSATHDKLSIYSIYILEKTLSLCLGKIYLGMRGGLTVVNAAGFRIMISKLDIINLYCGKWYS